MSTSQTAMPSRGGQSEIQDVGSRREAPSSDGPSSNQNTSPSSSSKDQTNEGAVAVSTWVGTVASSNSVEARFAQNDEAADSLQQIYTQSTESLHTFCC